jgi:hypothetical protein
MADPTIISTVIISVLSILGGILLKLHIHRCKCGNSECKCENDSKDSSVSSNSTSPNYKLSRRISSFFKNNSYNINNISDHKEKEKQNNNDNK